MSNIIGIHHLLLRLYTQRTVSSVQIWSGDRSQSVCNCYALPRLCLTKDHHIRAQEMNTTLKTTDTTIWMNTETRKIRYHHRQLTTVMKVTIVYDRFLDLFWPRISVIITVTLTFLICPKSLGLLNKGYVICQGYSIMPLSSRLFQRQLVWWRNFIYVRLSP